MNGGKSHSDRHRKKSAPIWFDIEDRERLRVRLRGLFTGLWQSVESIHKDFPPTGFAKKALQAAAATKKAGGLFYFEKDFVKSTEYDVFGMLIQEIYIDNNAWIENPWFPIVTEFKRKLLRDTLMSDSRSKEKWTKRLKVCDKTRDDIELGQDLIVKITQRLCEDTLERRHTKQALEKRFKSKKKQTRESG